MKGTENSPAEARADRAAEDVLEELFEHASARKRPAAADEQAVRDALHAEWRELAGRRRKRRFIISLAAAASVTLAVLLGSELLRKPDKLLPELQLASIEKVTGNVFIHPGVDRAAVRPQPARRVLSSQKVVTGRDSRIALRWQDGTSLRIDQNSEVRFTAGGEIRLESGGVYIDTEMADKMTSAPVVLTPAGPVRHLGTQYMTEVSKHDTRLSVRQGQVALGAPGAWVVAHGGQQLSIDDSGAQRRRAIPVFGEMWQWTQDLAPAFESDGRSVSEFLEWVGRESGLEVRFETSGAEQVATASLLRGTIDLEPMAALAVTLQTTDLISEVIDGAILVSLRQ